MDPEAAEWGGAETTDLGLQPTPLTAQPSIYVQKKWKDIPYGMTTGISVRALHNGDGIYFWLSWQDDTGDDAIRDTDQFGDAAAVMFPVQEDAPLQSMGSPQQMINVWLWRADLESAYSVVSKGIGTTKRTSEPGMAGGGRFADGRWTVVLGRPMSAEGQGHVWLAPRITKKVAFAVWQGSNLERGGLKAATLEWQPLEIEA
jgi:DMSO reductase family type II enzyme heme b subunit